MLREMRDPLTTDDLDRITSAAATWHRTVTGTGGPKTAKSLPLLAAEIAGVMKRLPDGDTNARLRWEGHHIHSLLSRALFSA